MSVRIKVFGFLLPGGSDNKSEIVCNGSTVEEVLRDAVGKYPNIKPLPFDENNYLNPSVSIYVNKTHIRLLQGEKTKVESGDEILIVPVMAGG